MSLKYILQSMIFLYYNKRYVPFLLYYDGPIMKETYHFFGQIYVDYVGLIDRLFVLKECSWKMQQMPMKTSEFY